MTTIATSRLITCVAIPVVVNTILVTDVVVPDIIPVIIGFGMIS